MKHTPALLTSSTLTQASLQKTVFNVEEKQGIPGVQYDAASKHLPNAQPNVDQHHELLPYAPLRSPSHVFFPPDLLLESVS